MKKFFQLMLLAGMLLGCKDKLSKEQSDQLWHAYHNQNYFLLDRLVSQLDTSSEDPDILFYKAKRDYVFNQPEASNHSISLILSGYASHFNDTLISDLYLMRSVNYTRLEEYKNAWVNSSIFLKKYGSLYDSVFIRETKDDLLVREALADVPKMSIVKTSDEKIPIHRDIAGLINLRIGLTTDSLDFVFDTGANMSVMVASVAKSNGIKTINKKIYVQAITGKRIEASLALVNLKIGNIEIKNSPFIVFPDSILSFGQGAYIIRGIIGFPIMNALKEFSLIDDKFLLIPQKPEKTAFRNFALDQATPVIMVTFQHDTLPFHFDTGANSTTLYYSFYEKYKDEILKTCTKKNSTMGGAGGNETVEAYILPKAALEAGNEKTELDSLVILTKTLTSNQNNLYGNFGQDFMRKYRVMRINFESMQVSFRK